MKYRSRTDIFALILQTIAATPGTTKTRIMYNAYLSYAQLKEYLSFLLGKGLIRCEEGSELYKITQKGMTLLQKFENISDLITVDDQHLIQSDPFSSIERLTNTGKWKPRNELDSIPKSEIIPN